MLSFRGYCRALSAVAFLLFCSAGSANSVELSEYRLKAAVIYKLARFVDWPEAAFDNESDPLDVCVLGSDPFGDQLSLIEGREVDGRPLQVRGVGLSVDRVREEKCHVVFVSQSERRSLEQALDALEGQPVLTIGDMDRFCFRGGMVNLVADGGRLRFEINFDRAVSAGLELDSQLLDLATIVVEKRSRR